MHPAPHAIIDLETIGTSAGSGIIEIGAALVGDHPTTPLATMQVPIALRSLAKLGCTADADCLAWWHDDPDRAAQWQRITTDPTALPVTLALATLCAWVARHRPTTIWMRGPAFDQAHLERLATRVGLQLPWHYGAVRDIRTAADLMDMRQQPATHGALDDCLRDLPIVSGYRRLVRDRLSGLEELAHLLESYATGHCATATA